MTSDHHAMQSLLEEAVKVTAGQHALRNRLATLLTRDGSSRRLRTALTTELDLALHTLTTSRERLRQLRG